MGPERHCRKRMPIGAGSCASAVKTTSARFGLPAIEPRDGRYGPRRVRAVRPPPPLCLPRFASSLGEHLPHDPRFLPWAHPGARCSRADRVGARHRACRTGNPGRAGGAACRGSRWLPGACRIPRARSRSRQRCRRRPDALAGRRSPGLGRSGNGATTPSFWVESALPEFLDRGGPLEIDFSPTPASKSWRMRGVQLEADVATWQAWNFADDGRPYDRARPEAVGPLKRGSPASPDRDQRLDRASARTVR